MIELILNDEHLSGALAEALKVCRHRLFVATANVKDLHLPDGAGGARSIVEAFAEISDRGVEIRLLHSGIPSGPLLERLKRGMPAGLTMRRCPRVHAKAVIADGVWMYLGSANLTGAGLGAKGPHRRNFEAGIVTDDTSLIDPVADMLAGVFEGAECGECGRKANCPAPLEEPEL
ncbi:MAG TPA: phospholipase D family protein [Phycisphaerae bacterium]|nr:phospholipase D family protein [Phycisphaerae bacterium]